MTGRQPFRIQPQLPAAAMKTYQLLAPPGTHWRPATCAEVDCPPHRHGWATTVLTGSDDETMLLRAASGTVDGHRRRFAKQPEAGGFVRYVFPPDQPCFRASTHRVPLEREPLYVVRDGDWRGNPRGTQPHHHTRGEHWVEDFGGHQQRLADRLERG